jgi:valyl-tRNA synthetase
MLADYPRGGAPEVAAEREMDLALRAISTIRAVRGESNLPPGKRIPVRIRALDPGDRRSLTGAAGLIRALAQVSELTVEGSGPRIRRAAVALEPGMEIAIPLAGLVDFAEEERRLSKEIARCEGERNALLRKLENPSFLERAPEAVVSKDRARSGELAGKIERLKQQLQVVTEPEEDTMNVEQKNPYGSPFGTPSDSQESTGSSGTSTSQERPWERPLPPSPTFPRSEPIMPAPTAERLPPKRAPAKLKAKVKAKAKARRVKRKVRRAKRAVKRAVRRGVRRAVRKVPRGKARRTVRRVVRKVRRAVRRKVRAAKKTPKKRAKNRKASRRR